MENPLPMGSGFFGIGWYQHPFPWIIISGYRSAGKRGDRMTVIVFLVVAVIGAIIFGIMLGGDDS